MTGRKACVICLLCLLLMPLVGCGGNDNSLPPGTRQFGTLQFTLTSDKATYAKGQPITLTLTVKNVGSQTVTTGYPKNNVFVMEALQQARQQVWGSGGGNNNVITVISYAPGETKTFTATWDQKNDIVQSASLGQQVPSDQLIPSRSLSRALTALPLNSFDRF